MLLHLFILGFSFHAHASDPGSAPEENEMRELASNYHNISAQKVRSQDFFCLTIPSLMYSLYRTYQNPSFFNAAMTGITGSALIKNFLWNRKTTAHQKVVSYRLQAYAQDMCQLENIIRPQETNIHLFINPGWYHTVLNSDEMNMHSSDVRNKLALFTIVADTHPEDINDIQNKVNSMDFWKKQKNKIQQSDIREKEVFIDALNTVNPQTIQTLYEDITTTIKNFPDLHQKEHEKILEKTHAEIDKLNQSFQSWSSCDRAFNKIFLGLGTLGGAYALYKYRPTCSMLTKTNSTSLINALD